MFGNDFRRTGRLALDIGFQLAFMDLDLGLSDLDAGFPGSGSLVFLDWIDGFHG